MIERRNEPLLALDVSELDPEDIRRRKLLNVMLLAVALSAAVALVLLAVTVPLGIAGAAGELLRLAGGAVSILVGAGLVYLISRHVSGETAAALFILLLIGLAAVSDVPRHVVSGRGLLIFTIPILTASVLLKPWASFVAAGLSSAVIGAMGMLVVGQPVPNVPAMLGFFLLALVSWASARSLERALNSVRTTNRRLRESEEQYRGIFDASTDAIIVLRTDGTIVDANPAASELYGYSRKELLQMNPKDLVHPSYHDRFDAFVERIPYEEELQTEAKTIRKDGSTIQVDVRLATFDYRGRTHLLNIVRDVTERARAQKALTEAEERYRRLIEEINEVIYSVDENGIVTYISPAVEDLTGYGVESVIGEPFDRFMHAEDRQRARERFADIAQGDEEVNEYRILTRRGRVRWISAHSRPSFSQGEFRGVRGILTDVTERREVEEALRASEARFRATFEDAAIGMAVVDMDGRLRESNAALQEILGYSAGELRGTRFVELTHPDDVSTDTRRFQELMTGERDAYRIEKRYICKEGSVIWGRLTGSLVRDAAGEPEFAVGMLEDVTERKKMEKDLRESEERYRTVFETTGTATIIIEPDMTISLVNAEAVRLSGYSREDIEGKMKWIDFVAPEDRERMREYSRLRLRNPDAAPAQYEFHLIDYDGDVKDILLTINTIPGTRKSVASLLDISARKRTEEEIRRHSKQIEALLEIDRAISSTLDLDQVLDLVLGKLDEVLPFDSASIFLLSDGTAELVAAKGHPDPRGALETAFEVEHDLLARRMLDREQPLILADAQADERFRERGGSGYVRSWIGVPLVVGGAPVGLMTIDHRKAGIYDETSAAQLQMFARQAAVAIDNAQLFEQAQCEIAQRKQAEEALERQLRHVSLLNEITRAVTARHDLDSILSVVARRLETGFEGLNSLWLRDGDSDVFSLVAVGAQDRRSDAPPIPDQVSIPREMAELRHFLFRGEVAYIRDGTSLGILALDRLMEAYDVRSFVVAPLSIEDRVLGMIASARREPDAFNSKEVSFLEGLSKHIAVAVHQAQLHQNLQAAYDDLRQTQRAMMRQQRLRALGEMASGIAHDINNAISPVPLYTALIARETDLDEGAASYLHTIEMAVSDVEETVGRMRQFYREREDEDLAQLEVNKTVREAIELTRPRWRDLPQERGVTIRLEKDLADDLPPVTGTEGEIRQAVTNLILNAVDAMPHGGTLTLRTRARKRAPARVVVEVIDTGIGMDEETQERCFEPFFSTKGERGSGMGLAMVYGTMQRQGGDVQVESVLGEGTTMRLLFPVRELVAEEGVEQPVAPPSPLRILCVDDELLLREALQEALEREGHRVELADGGESGLRRFRAARQRGKPFDVVITDLGMPFVSGRQVARTVKKEAPETPVILLTGWGVRLSAEQDVPADVDLMMTKPPTIPALNRALAQVTLGEDGEGAGRESG